MFYYTYLVIPTNENSSLFGTIYFGQHRTNNINDGYIAGGKIINDYLKKYPNDYYREIIKFYNNEEELNQAEYELIHPHLEKDYCLNLVEGGRAHSPSKKLKKQISDKLKGIKKSEEFKENLRRLYKGRQVAVQDEKCRENMSKSKKGKPSPFKDKKHTEEAKEKNRQAHLKLNKLNKTQ